VPSVEQLQRDITGLKKDEADLRKKLSDAQGAAAKDAAAAQRKRESALRASSLTSAQSYLREAERLEKRAADHTKKAADIARKLADNGKKQGDKVKALASAEREAQRRRDREDERRRQTEKRHAQEVARLSRPTVRYVHEVRVIEPPKPERLRVLYLAANPEMDLRVDAEVRQVREAVRKALHRDLVDIDHRPAATPEDLLDGINELRPHVIHFTGHGDGTTVLFDDGQVDGPQGRAVPFGLLGRALGATDTPPKLLVLNSCESLDGANALLGVVPVVIGMSASVSDLAAAVFAARFYSAIASAQSVAAALEQAAVAVDMAGLGEGWMPDAVVREGVDLGGLVLVHPPPVSEAS
jgi:CHAT domain